jgi:hypothetical protein
VVVDTQPMSEVLAVAVLVGRVVVWVERRLLLVLAL